MQPIPPTLLAFITGGAARITPRVTTGREEIKQAVTALGSSVKDIAASRQNDSGSSTMPIMMMMMMKNRG